MIEIDWTKTFEILIPIVAVLLAGLIALYQMRQNVKLGAKLKWKEEFRNRVIEFTNVAMLLYNKAIWVDKEPIDDKGYNTANEYIEILYKLHTIYYSISIMLDRKDLRTEVLYENYRLIVDKSHNEATDLEQKVENEDFVEDFYDIAKEIYDDSKYINSLV